MSKYTTEVRYFCEYFAGLDASVGGKSVAQVIAEARPKIFNFDYPIFDEEYRPVLETKILRHFYTREIASETYALWHMWLENRLNEIMPYYNKLYSLDNMEFNPLQDADYTIDHKGDGSSNTEDNQDTKGTRQLTKGGQDTSSYNRSDKNNEWNLYSDTPQGGIHGILGAEDDPSLGSNGYLTNATHIIGDSDGSHGTDVTQYGGTEYGENGSVMKGTSNTVSTDNYIQTVKGKFPGRSYAKMIKEYRDTLINVDMRIIGELEDLFFGLW